MFEHYTEAARRVIFFARYEASQFGASTIEPEHLLLGVLREDVQFLNRFLDLRNARQRVAERTGQRPKVSTSIDMPLSDPSKRILAFAYEEAELLNHRHIGTEHLLLGMLREKDCLAEVLLREAGASLESLREDFAQ